jgi:hypothetical protein
MRQYVCGGPDGVAGFDVANDRIGEVFTHGAKIGSAIRA